MCKESVLISFAAMCVCFNLAAIIPDKASSLDDVANNCGIPVTFQAYWEEKRICGGRNANVGDWPWVAYIYLKEEGPIDGYICSGSLINSQYILTAAHCAVYQEYPESYGVILGEHTASKISGEEMSFSVEKVVRHEDFDEVTLLNDIALMKLSDPVEFTSHIRPICLPERDFPTDANEKKLFGGKHITYAGKTCVAKGWGQTETRWKSDVMQQLGLTILPRLLCTPITSLTNFYRDTVRAEDFRFCAGGVFGEDMCNSIGGGPLACQDEDSGRYYLNGITSFRPDPCAQKNLPGVYTEVSKYHDWIVHIIEE